MARKKVIFILIDALGANYFARQRSHLPYLSSLAEQGLFAERVRPATPGTSRPGRATMLTGVETAVHGVYGNSILQDDAFRPATEHDIRTKTIARIAQEAGLDVASLGFGLLPPAHTSIHIDPWWQHLQQQGLSNIKIPSKRAAANIAPVRRDPGARLAEFLNVPLSLGSTEAPDSNLHPHIIGLASDHLMLQLAGDLACSDDAPDLILTEFASTDVIQHYHGFDCAATNWAYQIADMAVGRLLHRLALAGRMDDYVLVIASDHGQAAIHTALYPQALIPHDRWVSEGASLHVLATDPAESESIHTRLRGLGVTPLEGAHLPEAVRAKGLVTFVAPDGCAFERRPPSAADDATTGSPTMVSTHGLGPGHPGDDAIAIVAGAGTRGRIASADLCEVAPTIAHLLGLAFDGSAARAWL